MSTVERYRQGTNNDDELEISISHIIKFFKQSLITVITWAICLAVIGGIYAFVQPDQFVTEIKVMPELQNKSGSNLSGISSLAGLAGINVDGIGAGTEAIRPDLYPTILKSIPFGLHMLKQPIAIGQAKPISLELYMKEETSSGGLSFMSKRNVDSSTNANWNRNLSRSILFLSRSEEAVVNDVLERVNGEIDKKTGILTIAAKMSNPEVAAQTAKYALDYLTAYATNYRTGKSRQQANFLQQQVDQAKRRYQTAEYALSSYRDQNRSLYLNTSKLEEQKLQAEYILTQGIYNDLAKQLEQAKIKVQEEMPVFQTLEPARVPLTKYGPKRTLIVAGFLLFGAVIGLMVYFVRHFLLPHK